MNSLAMILVCEIGDKTFFIGAIMAMQHPPFVVCETLSQCNAQHGWCCGTFAAVFLFILQLLAFPAAVLGLQIRPSSIPHTDSVTRTSARLLGRRVLVLLPRDAALLNTQVFLGAISALIVMTVLSSLIGFALPNLLPKQYTHYAAAILFLYFGCGSLSDCERRGLWRYLWWWRA